MFTEKFRQRCCPICNSAERKKLYRQSFAYFSNIGFLEGYDVVICGGCGFGYADLIPEQSEFDLYYQKLSKYEHRDADGSESPIDSRRFIDVADLIAHFTEKNTRILEIGCATGTLLGVLKRNGFRHVQGLDPSAYCAEAARRLFGVEVMVGTISTMTTAATFDFIILIGVLEHIADLDQALAKLYKLTSDGGSVYIEVPDAAGFSCCPDAPFQQFSTEHINYFSVHALSNLMRRHGFELQYREQKMKPQTGMQFMPTVGAVYRKSCYGGDDCFNYDAETEAGLTLYIQRSKLIDKGIHREIDPLVDGQEPIIVWGVGTHTFRLLKACRLGEANIMAFIDSNPMYATAEYQGIPVLQPCRLQDYPYRVLISSRVYQNEIVSQIRDRLKCENELILLY